MNTNDKLVLFVPMNAAVAERFLAEVRHGEHFGKLPIWPDDNPFTVGNEKVTPSLYAWTSAEHAVHVARLHGWRLELQCLVRVELSDTAGDALLASKGLAVQREGVAYTFDCYQLFALNSPDAEFTIDTEEFERVKAVFAGHGITS